MTFSENRASSEKAFIQFLEKSFSTADASHDVLHIKRVVKNAEALSKSENGNPDIVLPAAWLHDCVSVPKNSPDRKIASRLAARAATNFLAEIGYSTQLIPPIAHAIEAHSFSAGIPPETLEAKIVQDADRLDALGAIGITRCFLTGALFGTPLYAETDPFCESRPPNDQKVILDHFYQKLLTLENTMQTDAGKSEAAKRTVFMRQFLQQLREEISRSL